MYYLLKIDNKIRYIIIAFLIVIVFSHLKIQDTYQWINGLFFVIIFAIPGYTYQKRNLVVYNHCPLKAYIFSFIASFFLIMIQLFFIRTLFADKIILDNNFNFIIFVNLIIITPVSEELFFRGFCYHYFSDKLNKKSAVFISTLLFSAFHLNSIAIVFSFMPGLLLSFIRYKYNSLKLCILTHSLINLTVFFYLQSKL